MLFKEKFRSRILNTELEKAPTKQTAAQETNPFCPLYNIMTDSANIVLNIRGPSIPDSRGKKRKQRIFRLQQSRKGKDSLGVSFYKARHKKRSVLKEEEVARQLA